MLKYLLALLAAFALHSTASALEWADVVKDRDSLCAKLAPAPLLQPASAYYKSLSPARMFCESIKYQIVKKGDKPVASAPLDLVNQPANGYWVCGLASEDLQVSVNINAEIIGGKLDAECAKWRISILSEFTFGLQPPQKISIPIVKVTPETIKQREAADAAAKVAAAAAAAKRAKEVSESVEQARKRIQLIPISVIDGLNTMTAAQTNERAMANLGQPAPFCTWSQNELAALSVNQINGMSQQAALNLEYCMLIGYKEERHRARRQYNDPVISTFGFGALEPTMTGPESSALKNRLDKECPLRGTTSHCVDFCAGGGNQSRCVMMP